MYIITVNSSLYIFTYLVLCLCIYVIVVVPVHTSLSKLLYIVWLINWNKLKTEGRSRGQQQDVNMGTYPQWDPPRQCPGPNHVCDFHRRPARCSYKYSKHLCRWHQIVPQCEISRGYRENTARPGQPHEMVPPVAVRFQRSRVQSNSFRNRQHKTPVHYERHPIGSNMRREGFGHGDRWGVKFHLLVSQEVKKASRMLGLVHATFTCLDETTIPRLFTTMVRPHLEYGNVIWHPRYRRDTLEVEKIQRRVTKLIPRLKSLSYEKWLRVLRLPSLEHRRRRGDMLQVPVYKVNGIDRINPSLLFDLYGDGIIDQRS